MIKPGIHQYTKLERVVDGQPAASVVSEEVAIAGASRVMVVTNASLSREGRLLDGIVAALGDRFAGQFAGCRAHVPYDDVLTGAAYAREIAADLLLAVGGGSVADATKLIQLCLWHNAKTAAELRALRGFPSPAPIDHRPMPRSIAVPTTLSAAELNWGASATDVAAGVKDIFGHPMLIPRSVILDPDAAATAPSALLLATGIKALDHAVERFCALRRSPFSDALSAEAVRLLSDALPRIHADPADRDARHQAQIGMWLSTSGAAAGTPVGASHGIGHVLGAHLGVPHGLTSCVMLAAVMRWNRPANADRQALLAPLIEAGSDDAAAAIAGLVARLGLPGRLRDVGVQATDLASIAEKSVHEGAVRRNPRAIVDAAAVRDILDLAW